MGKLFFKLPREVPSAMNVNKLTSNTMSTKHGHNVGQPDSPYEPNRPRRTDDLDPEVLKYMMESVNMTEEQLNELSEYTFNILKKEAEAKKAYEDDEEKKQREDMTDEGHTDDYINFYFLLEKIEEFGYDSLDYLEVQEYANILRESLYDLGFDIEKGPDGKAIYTLPDDGNWHYDEDGKIRYKDGRTKEEVILETLSKETRE